LVKADETTFTAANSITKLQMTGLTSRHTKDNSITTIKVCFVKVEDVSGGVAVESFIVRRPSLGFVRLPVIIRLWPGTKPVIEDFVTVAP
jgi:hypothetical protein